MSKPSKKRKEKDCHMLYLCIGPHTDSVLWKGSITWKLCFVIFGKLSGCCNCVISVNCGINRVTCGHSNSRSLVVFTGLLNN